MGILSGLATASLAAEKAEDFELIPPQESLLPASLFWDQAVTVRAGFGYKDNVLLSAFHREASPFFTSGLEFSLFRYPFDGFQWMFLLTGDDVRYWRSPDVNKEQDLIAVTQLKQRLGKDWYAGTTLQYAYVDQVQDVSISEAALASARVQGHTIAVRPFLRKDFQTNLWAQLELEGTRQLLRAPLDNYWQFGPKVTLNYEWGRRSELRFSYEMVRQIYDTRLQTDATGLEIPGAAGLVFWQQKVVGAWSFYWDERRHWRTSTTFEFDYSVDNGSGYFNYFEYQLTEQLLYAAKGWELKGKVGLNYYDFPVRPVSDSTAVKLHKSTLTLNVRAEKKLSKLFKLYGEYEYERSLSNEAFFEYKVNTVSGGLELEF